MTAHISRTASQASTGTTNLGALLKAKLDTAKQLLGQ
jgi:hypothetical protein